jgi:hydrogenase expression/formation protein HypE
MIFESRNIFPAVKSGSINQQSDFPVLSNERIDLRCNLSEVVGVQFLWGRDSQRVGEDSFCLYHVKPPQSVTPGDAVILSGDVARRGIAILAAREGLGFESAMTSDCAPLAEPVLALFEAGIAVHCLRDLTRGGLAIEISEHVLPVREDMGSACDVLGLDPFHIANEGRFVAFVPAGEAARAIEVLRRHPVSAGASAIGAVAASPAGRVACKSAIGGTHIIDMLSGEQLPRIC